MKNKYMATCVPGAEEILKEEILELIQEINNLSVERGKVFFASDAGLDEMMELKCADNIYKIISRFNIGSHKDDLIQFSKNIMQVDFYDIYNNLSIKGKKDNQNNNINSNYKNDNLNNNIGIKNYKNSNFKNTDNRDKYSSVNKNYNNRRRYKIIVSAGRTGKHTYSRYDLSAAATEAMLSDKYFISGDEKDHDIAFRIDVKDDSCIFSIKLTPPEFRFRGGSFHSSKGGIRPSIAHCLVRISRPQKSDVFYDPFCGAGTIPYERALFKYKKIFASDIDDEVISTAGMNLKNDIILFKADAANTRIKSESIDAVVTNMPWGKQIVPDDLEGLYYGFIKELGRILKASGRAVILTDRHELLQAACGRWGFSINRLADLSLHGLHPSIYILMKDVDV